METSLNTDAVILRDELSRHDLTVGKIETLLLGRIKDQAQENPEKTIRVELVIHPEPKQ